ncbi:MAG: hypothetical protein KDK06_10930 [Gammaproteobacteria bacterium]|nr:hypothetical protein [Gammaproteobacteria bacterium]
MKWLALVLLVANLGLFGWQYSRQVDEATREVMTRKPAATDAPPLQLLSELDRLPPLKDAAAAEAVRTPPSAEVNELVEPADRCLDIGPFDAAADRDRLRDWLRDYVARTASRSENVRQRRFFWVYLEPTTDEAAQANLDDLRNRGVTDYMLIRRGELKNAISLGLFRSQDSVNRRLAEMSEKGYKPVVVPKFETTEKFWLAAQLAAGNEDSLDIPSALLGTAEARPVSCQAL